MEKTGVTPPGAVSAPDLADVVTGPGPFATVYLTTESTIENAAQRSEQHWKPVRSRLADEGVPDSVLAAIDPLVADAHLQGETLAVVARADGVLHVEHGPEPTPDRATCAAVPALVPILSWRQASPTHVTVLADRTGADISVIRHDRPDLTREAGDGDGFGATKVKPGGWSQRRYQERAENTWEKNADDVAKQVTSLVERFDASLVILAGDVRATELIRNALPAHVTERLEVVDGSRAEDGSDEDFTAAVRGRLDGAVARDTVRLLDKLKEELGQNDRAGNGPAATLGALARAQVEVLLVHEDQDDERTAFFGPEPTQVGTNRDDVAGMGVDEPAEGRLVDVAVRAALATGAGIRVVPGGDIPKGGLGAILRWS
jgi:peptide subunit release factor 1 (eRF1)